MKHTSFIILLILVVPLFFVSPQIPPAQATDPPPPEYTIKAINQTYLNGYSTSGSYLDTHYDDANYHVSTGKRYRFYDPELGYLYFYLLEVVYTFNVNSTGVPLPRDYMNITNLEVNGKAKTDQASSETVELNIFNWRTNTYEKIDEFPGNTSDQLLNWTTTNNCTDYVAANGDMKLKWDFFAQDFQKLYVNYQCIKLTIAANRHKWTFMVYLDSDWCWEFPGEHHLVDIVPGEYFGYGEMNEMETVGSTNDVAIIVQIDRYYGGADRYLIIQDTNTSIISSPIMQNLGEVNMADPATLTDFINWTNCWYPADHLSLVLHDHGGGFLGACKDNNDTDLMTMTEFKTALSNAKAAIGNRTIDLIGFVACLMQMTEVAYQIREYGKVLVASEEVMYAIIDLTGKHELPEINVGWPFDTILANLTTTPSMNETMLARVIADRYEDLFNQIPEHVSIAPTISAVDLSQIDALAVKLNATSVLLINKLNDTLKTYIQDKRMHAQEFYYRHFIDLYNITEALYAYPDVEIQNATFDLMTQINSTVIYEWHWPYNTTANPPPPPPDAHGISIYFPSDSSIYIENRTAYEELDISTNYSWDDFLRAYYEIT